MAINRPGYMRIVVLLGLALLVAGCHGTTFDVSEGESRLVKAQYRAILSVERAALGSDGQPVLDDRGRPVASVSVCAEPSPDALKSTALVLAKDAKAGSVEALLKASSTTEYVGLRTQTIQLLRDAYFRLCEAFMNDGIDAVAYDVLQRRFQSQIVALLAVEQLTGAVVAGRRGTAGHDPATQLARIAEALEESEDALRALLTKREKAKADLDALEDKGKTLPDGKDKEANKTAVEVARRALAAVDEQVERRQHVIRELKASFVRATQSQATQSTPDQVEPPGASVAGVGRSADTGVADAVRAITLNAINQDYESQVCFETLRYHNHLGQFRNDINHAFDSGGIPTNLAEGVFLDHCRNLFASQADFRNARASAAEAFADAIGEVTKKIGTEFTAVDAASYIRALAESVPMEPGVAFLPHERDPKGGTMLLPDGSTMEIHGRFEAKGSIAGDGVAGGRDENGN